MKGKQHSSLHLFLRTFSTKLQKQGHHTDQFQKKKPHSVLIYLLHAGELSTLSRENKF